MKLLLNRGQNFAGARRGLVREGSTNVTLDPKHPRLLDHRPLEI
jgi:hypothetical protein